MIRKYFFYSILIFLIFSCSSKNKVPSHIIQPADMKSILWDVMSAQSLATALQRQDSSINAVAETKVLTQKIFEIHKITAVDFNESYTWYVRHPEAIKVIFDSLYAQKQRENTLRLQPVNLKDTLHKKTFVP